MLSAHKVSKLILTVFFYSITVLVHAQEKYAVVVGIDNYYSSPGIKHHASLGGCVNDAKSIKGLLENRFGFKPQQVYTLYNEKATKRTLINQLRIVFQKAKPGDAVVFFFSGHGVWMTNETLIGDPIKRGMSQAIVMNDLYSPGWDCLLRDETMKDIFNQFVDKKITVTTIFDCCYSANLLMNIGPPRYWEGFFPQPPRVKDIEIDHIPYTPVVRKPTGCRYDPAGQPMDTLDSDLDGYPDCMDWEIYTPPFSNINDSGISKGDPHPDHFGMMPDNYYDSSWFAGAHKTSSSDPVTRSFNLKDALKVNNRSSIRPSERDGSRFASLAGAADNMKGLEIRDVAGIKHGAFTAALLMVYQTSPPTITIEELWRKIEAIMKQQFFDQTPGMDAEASRFKGNLVGTDTVGFRKRLVAKSVSVNSNKITLDKGSNDGLANGNVLTDLTLNRSEKIVIIKTNEETATAIDRSKGKIKPGHTFELTDPYTISNGHIKVHIPSAPFTASSYMAFFNSTVMPLANKSNYMDYNYEDFDQCREVIFYRDATKVEKIRNQLSGSEGEKKDLFCVFLPVPAYIKDQVVAQFKPDQNFQLVNDPRQADVVLYINYTRPKKDAEGGFMVYWHPLIAAPQSVIGEHLFTGKKVVLSSMDISSTQQRTLAKTLHDQLRDMIRKKTNDWINYYKRR